MQKLVQLPMADVRPMPSASARRARFATMHGLLLDNSESVSETLRQSATMVGMYTVSVFTDANRALFAISQERCPDVVFLNASGTAIDANRICQSIRKPGDFRYPFIPIVVIRANATRSDVVKTRDAGADEFLACPFSPASLAQRLTSIAYDRRGFVDVPGFFGPDRRRGAMAQMLGAERRSGNDTLIDPDTGRVFIG